VPSFNPPHSHELHDAYNFVAYVSSLSQIMPSAAIPAPEDPELPELLKLSKYLSQFKSRAAVTRMIGSQLSGPVLATLFSAIVAGRAHYASSWSDKRALVTLKALQRAERFAVLVAVLPQHVQAAVRALCAEIGEEAAQIAAAFA
jgi:hypothetical protein